MKNLIFAALISPFCAFSQEKISGTILESVEDKEIPLSGANVYW